jgi:cobaltochelatase CobN
LRSSFGITRLAKNLSASYLNLPKSLDATLSALKLAGYKTDTLGDKELTRQLQRLLAPFYRPPADNRELNALIDDGLADLMPLENYREWINSLPAEVSAGILKDWGAPKNRLWSWNVRVGNISPFRVCKSVMSS